MLIGFAEIKQGRMARAGGDKSFDEGANIPARNIKLRLIPWQLPGWLSSYSTLHSFSCAASFPEQMLTAAATTLAL